MADKLPLEVDGDGVPAANDNAYALSGCSLVFDRANGSKGGSPARFSNYAQRLPKFRLRISDIFIRYQHHAIDVTLRDRKHQLAHALWRERVSRNAAGFRIDRP